VLVQAFCSVVGCMWVVSYMLFPVCVSHFFIFVAVGWGTSHWSVLLTACEPSQKKRGGT
jgi:hypothetical protein